ncbi:MAG: uroporphyrinogen decarboxylase family protein [Anaerolineae bacterium]|jgi:uroporphyrinogen decarboxylase
MTSRGRVVQALDHQEPDRVPFDLGGTGLSTIHVTAYENLRRHLMLLGQAPRIGFMAEQLVLVDEDVSERLATDVRPVLPGLPSGFEYVLRDEGEYQAYTDEWGIGWRKPKEGGFYYDMYHHPLAGASSLADLKALRFPDPLDDARFAPLRARAEAAAAQGKAVALAGPSAGIAEVYSWLRGYEEYYVDLALNQDWVAYMLDRLVEFKSAYWERALAEIGGLVDVVVEADDLGGQNAPLMSPRTYRKLIQPRHRRLFSSIKQQAPVKVFYHTCGAVRKLIPDLIDAGIDILNPIQISSPGMDPQELKREYGRDLVFWGGGVDTQRVLGVASPEEIQGHVRRNIEALAPGGGFVFAAVHDIQANVPPENIMAMWEAWREYGLYT